MNNKKRYITILITITLLFSTLGGYYLYSQLNTDQPNQSENSTMVTNETEDLAISNINECSDITTSVDNDSIQANISDSLYDNNYKVMDKEEYRIYSTKCDDGLDVVIELFDFCREPEFIKTIKEDNLITYYIDPDDKGQRECRKKISYDYFADHLPNTNQEIQLNVEFMNIE